MMEFKFDNSEYLCIFCKGTENSTMEKDKITNLNEFRHTTVPAIRDKINRDYLSLNVPF